jgi:hypothetical protein
MVPANKIILTPEQESYLRENYATIIHHTLCQHLGISERTLVRIARDMGLRKDMMAIEGQRRERISKSLKEMFIRNPGKKHPENGQKTQFKPGYNAIEFFGEEKFKEMHRKSVETRRKRYEEDRVRKKWGLPQLTNMRVIRQPRQKVLDRSYFKRLGYIIDNENNIAYWTDETHRATKLELKPRFFKFMPYEQH